jgi:DNA-binding MarR family transcriptional regulator
MIENNLSESVFVRLVHCANTLNKSRGCRTYRRDSFTPQQYLILNVLEKADRTNGMTINELGRHLMVTRQNLHNVLSRMEAEDLVLICRSPSDLRERKVNLSKRGHDLLATYRRNELQYIANTMLNGFSEGEKNMALVVITKILKNMRNIDWSR